MARGANFNLEIEGWDELEDKLRALGVEINSQELLEDSMNEGAEVVRSAIASSAPYRTGQLSGNIQVSRQGRKKYSLRIGPSGRGFYGRFLEYGTSRMAARPFVRPAFDGVRSEAERTISEAIWRAVEGAAK
jgi:HK97 gp10 family phage protein